MNNSVIPQGLAIEAMRSSAFRNTAQALAELIDNSIQAGLKVEEKTHCEVLAVDTISSASSRRSRNIDEIAVYDNASGMSPETLRCALQFGNGTNLDPSNQKSIGKFGMGLPNSSISRCRRLDVYTWQDNNVIHSYLDVDLIIKGDQDEIEEPQETEIPPRWKSLIKHKVNKNGTLVVWSRFDKLKEKRSKPLLKNAEALVGRTYRYFINSNKVSIRLAAYSRDGDKYEKTFEQEVRANDPLGLMEDTTCPGLWAKEAPFIAFGRPYVYSFEYKGQKQEVKITFSHCKEGPRKEGGNNPIGKWANANIGVSVVRAKRELELNETWVNTYDPVERWWGVEVEFEPVLDDLFGVTHDKQSAKDFFRCNLVDGASDEGLSEAEFRQQLLDDKDDRLHLYKISSTIDSTLSTIRAQVKKMSEGTRTIERGGGSTKSEDIAQKATIERREKKGDLAESDKQEKNQSANEKKKLLSNHFQDLGLSPTDADEKAQVLVDKGKKYVFENQEFPGYAIFDIKFLGGTVVITLNSKHPASDKLFEILNPNTDNVLDETPGLTGLRLLLAAWARMEDESSADDRVAYEDIRSAWGIIARDFFKADD